MTVDLPTPMRSRFQPLRSGLVNLYRYDDQEFWFEDGHLILRGNNGTGKSRILALQLPFLFDGEVASHRMEPDGDAAKRIEWNLLLGGRYTDRLGYTWLELGRLAPETTAGAEYITIGCGLSAAAGRGLVGRWFFVTRQRVGRDLFLIAPSGQPLSRERLEQAIGGKGDIYLTAAAHREAVDKALFGLGKVRYDALINLLIQLRQPQLSRQLDEARLSKALSEALAPPAPQMVADVAEAFRALESDHDALEAFRAANRAVEQFLSEYRRYAQIAARRRAATVRRRHSIYEDTMRTLRDAERALADAEIVEHELATKIETARIDEQAAAAKVETLAASPAMQDAQALRRAREAAERAAADVLRAVRDAEHRLQIEAHRSHELAAATESARTARAGLSELRERLQDAAAALGIERRHAEIVTRLELEDEALTRAAPEQTARPPLDDAIRALLHDLLAERRRALKQLRVLADDLRRALAALEQTEAAVRTLEGDVDEAAQAQVAAMASLDGAARDLLALYRQWAAGARALALPPAAALVDALTAWVAAPGGPIGPSPLMSAIATSLAVALQRLSAAEAGAKARLEEATTQLAGLRGERDRVASGEHRPPPVPFTRNEAARQERQGAPLWRLVDFVEDLTEPQRAGLEAALEAAGILDAWVTPDGRLLGPDEHDVLLVPAGPPVEQSGQSHLGAVLRPAIDRTDPRTQGVTEDTVLALFERITLGMGSSAVVAVDFDGRFRVGPLDGRWAKASAEHIGEGARRMARKRRLEELGRLIAEALEEERIATEALDSVRAGIAAAQAEAAAGPDDRLVRIAAADLEARSRSVALLRGRLATAERRAMDARELVASRREVRDDAAADLCLQQFADDLPALEEALARYGADIAALSPVLTHHRASAQRARDAAGRFQDAQTEAAAASLQLVELRGRAAALTAARDVLEESVGAAADDILTRHAEAQAALKELRFSINDLVGRERDAHDGTVLGRATLTRANADLAASEDERTAAVAALARLADARMLGVATPDLATEAAATWSVTRAVDVARDIESRLERLDASDSAWERTGRGLLTHIETLRNALLPHGHQASTSIEDDLVVVSVPFQGREHTMTEFGEILSSEVTSRQTLLSAREREVLENHLVGEVSMHLHDRLHAAEKLVREMNAELESRPMSTGMTLRFSWKPVDDGPPGLPEARRRLMRAGGTWTAAEREALGQFLGKQIADVRAANQAGTWQDHLAEALDYRRWHHFGVERQQDGTWRPLNRRTHGTGSGGEKAVALTLPQFAAAAAHYRSANATAPRLILLDEVFVGVDGDMRSKCMALLDTFELDFVMTSEREWGCYPTLPGLAIYQLATRPGIDAVGVTRFVWNGRERVRADVRPPGARATESTLIEAVADRPAPIGGDESGR